jgi:hypothetical protein
LVLVSGSTPRLLKIRGPTWRRMTAAGGLAQRSGEA